MALEPGRLASGAVFGVVIGAPSILLLGSEEGPKVVFYLGVALMVVLETAWIASLLYLRTGRGRAARDEYVARRQQWGRPNRDRTKER
jgi:hypothetical protein